MARPDKVAAVTELTERFRDSNAVVLTEYRGLSVSQLKELRVSLRGNASYAVVKNTLTKIAARGAGVSAFDDLLEGPSAIAFVTGDPVETAKGLRDFSRAHPLLVIKGGVLDGKPLTPDELRKLADLESREVLLSKLAGAMQASLQGAVALFAAPLSQAARVIEALRQKAEGDPSLLAGGAGTLQDSVVEAPADPPASDGEASDDSEPVGDRADQEGQLPGAETAAEPVPEQPAARDSAPANGDTPPSSSDQG